MGGEPDPVIWEFAKRHGYVLVSKDSDLGLPRHGQKLVVNQFPQMQRHFFLERMTITMSHSEGLGKPSAMACCGVMPASIGVPAPGLSQATV